MVTNKVVLQFTPTLVDKPIIYRLVKDYDLVINILKADINPSQEGFVVVEISGDSESYNKGLEYLRNAGVRVEPLSGTIVWNREQCLHCGACASFCPTGALYLKRPEMEVCFEGSKCIVCQSCLDVCIARAVEVKL